LKRLQEELERLSKEKDGLFNSQSVGFFKTLLYILRELINAELINADQESKRAYFVELIFGGFYVLRRFLFKIFI